MDQIATRIEAVRLATAMLPGAAVSDVLAAARLIQAFISKGDGSAV